ncbi:8-amino-7-oxononanoate synthase [hydrothermal vent metagenome]|uniref:8-amino-7-oxononanoate synthase n=1 Tax=hydrothermal vent metagenome TaxID=652676 RepID=A0A3B1DJ52_9ZZZZ
MKMYFDKELGDLGQKDLKRILRPQEGSQGRTIFIEGKEVLNFCSNNYLGLASDKRLCDAAKAVMEEQGFGAGASRLVCGNMPAHQQLEHAIANFKGAEACLLFSSGYMANVGIISSLFGRGDIIFSDKFNHASIIDGILLSRAVFKRYPHRNMGVLEKMLKASKGHQRKVIITDSVFSMDGDIAPLDQIVALAQEYDCLVMIDEAHALGMMGKKGKGLAEHFNVEDKIDIQMGTLSKAAGSFGAYCCGSKALIEILINKARSFIYTTGLPPSVAAASQKAIEIIRQEDHLRTQLWEKTCYVQAALKQMGFNTMDSQTPIIPILVGEAKTSVQFSKRLLEEGFFISAIRPPTVPRDTARLRLTIMVMHTQEDLDYLLGKFQKIGKELCLI